MTRGNSVSLHVRRGDYVRNSRTNATHGVCSIEYYQSAIEYILERVKHPILYVFSDDIEWVKQNLRTHLPTEYIDHNQGAASHFDMRLMSLCRHHVIANSSFSWWGAWLNPDPNKIVIAPRKWFAANIDTGPYCSCNMDTFVKPAARQVRLTIAMPVFNGGARLAMAVESIVRQTFADWELLIIDDGSHRWSLGCTGRPP